VAYLPNKSQNLHCSVMYLNDYSISLEYKARNFFLQILFLRKEGSTYFWVHKNKYEDDYDEL
jgi:hypothetical protein